MDELEKLLDRLKAALETSDKLLVEAVEWVNLEHPEDNPAWISNTREYFRTR